MNEGSFDALTRRASLVALGTAGLAALGGSITADAKNKHGKKKKKSPDRCASQVAQCTSTITAYCAGEPACQDSISCCPILENCDFTGFFTCLVASAQT
jgi:hypothetical protein